VVIVLAIGPTGHEFKPDRGLCIFKDDKNPQHDSFGGEVKPSVPCREILRYVKYP
jgi:hypothetical protein